MPSWSKFAMAASRVPTVSRLMVRRFPRLGSAAGGLFSWGSSEGFRGKDRGGPRGSSFLKTAARLGVLRPWERRVARIGRAGGGTRTGRGGYVVLSSLLAGARPGLGTRNGGSPTSA